MKIEESKELYDSIEIPDELNFTVKKAIASVSKEKAKVQGRRIIMKRTFKRFSVSAAAVIICTTAALNTSQAFATEMSKLPIIGSIAKVLTVRSYHASDGMYDIDIDVPAITVDNGSETSSTELTDKINSEINSIVDSYKAQAEKDFEEYKEAFFATGGTEEEWKDRKMDIYIDYDVKCRNENILSLELIASKAWVASNEERHYYNIDLNSNSIISLEDLLGSDYIEICNSSIISQINERIKADENNIYFGFNDGDDSDGMIEGFKTITDETPFYINEKGNPVIVFEKYEIAPGYMGFQEFEITK